MTQLEVLEALGVLVYNFTLKQVKLLSALRAVRVAAFACEKDQQKQKILYSAYESIESILAQDIGTTIINKEIKDDSLNG